MELLRTDILFKLLTRRGWNKTQIVALEIEYEVERKKIWERETKRGKSNKMG